MLLNEMPIDFDNIDRLVVNNVPGMAGFTGSVSASELTLT